jgi:hypothetical protein
MAGQLLLRLEPVGEGIDAASKSGSVFNRPVLFDLKEATDCDSAMVAYLIRALRRRLAAHIPVGTVNASPTLAAELAISRVEPLFRVFCSEEDAIEAFVATAVSSPERPAL